MYIILITLSPKHFLTILDGRIFFFFINVTHIESIYFLTILTIKNVQKVKDQI